MAAEGRHRVAGVVDQLRERVVHHLGRVGEDLASAKLRAPTVRLSAEGGERHADQRQQAEHPEDQHQDDAPALARRR